MNKVVLALSVLLASGTAWSWLWPNAQINITPIAPTQKSAANNTNFSEPDLRQLEDARFFLDGKSLVFGSAPIIKPLSPPTPKTDGTSTPATSETPKETPAATTTTVIARPTFGWRLAGIIEGDGGTRALFVSGTASQTLRRGQALEGWTLASLSQTGVRLTHTGFTRTLTLFDKNNAPDAAYPRASNEETQNPSTNTQSSTPQSMQDFGPVQRGAAWSNPEKANTKQGGPVTLTRRGERGSQDNGNGRIEPREPEAAAPTN
jgi:hypothetical protein